MKILQRNSANCWQIQRIFDKFNQNALWQQKKKRLKGRRISDIKNKHKNEQQTNVSAKNEKKKAEMIIKKCKLHHRSRSYAKH